MKKILIFIWPEMGHLLPTYHFARKMKELGLDVTYACTDKKIIENIETHGFNAIEYSSIGDFIGQHKGQSFYNLIKLRQEFLVSLVKENAPDIIVCDSTEQHMVGIAIECKLKVCTYSTSIPDRHDWTLLPMGLTYTLIPRWYNPVYAIFCRLLWLLQRKLELLLHPYWKNYHKLVHETLERDKVDIKVDWRCSKRERFCGTPEVVLCPQCFDYKRTNVDDLFHDGPNIDFSREIATEVEEKNNFKKTIYCSFGTQLKRLANPMQVFSSVIQAFVNKPEWQLIIAVGKECFDELSARYQSNNIKIMEFAPQLSILRTADLAIIHGGVGTIKECIYFGVPLIVLPTGSDQYGNAYLVEQHSIGIQSSIKDVSAAKIEIMVDKIFTNPIYSQKINRMSELFQRDKDKSVVTDLVVSMLGISG